MCARNRGLYKQKHPTTKLKRNLFGFDRTAQVDNSQKNYGLRRLGLAFAGARLSSASARLTVLPAGDGCMA
jgi:hypothetical protein